MMSIWSDLKQKAIQANPELADKAAQALTRAKELAVEAGQKAAPVIKDATEKTAAFAKEKTPIVKAHAIKAFDDAKTRRAELQERAKRDKAARDEMIRTMYEITLTPADENFFDEAFTHFDHELHFFAISGQVLDTQKRSNAHLQASHSHSASNGGYIVNGYGSVGGSSHSSMHVQSYNTTEHEFWVKMPDGKEACFSFADSNIPMREGQWVTLAFVRASHSKTGNMCGIYNHSSAQYHVVMPGYVINRQFALYLEQPGFFNKKEVQTTLNRLLSELDCRLALIGEHVAIHNQVSA